jgi:hypothetical protein
LHDGWKANSGKRPAAGVIAGQFGYAAVYLFGALCALFGAVLVLTTRSSQP